VTGCEDFSLRLPHLYGFLSSPSHFLAHPNSSTADLREHMDVYASCGTKVGRVDHVEGDTIKLTKNDSPDGMHHTIPLSWAAKVHDHVHLDRDHKAVQSQWQPA
jgi:hypothetical protein